MASWCRNEMRICARAETMFVKGIQKSNFSRKKGHFWNLFRESLCNFGLFFRFIPITRNKYMEKFGEKKIYIVFEGCHVYLQVTIARNC